MSLHALGLCVVAMLALCGCSKENKALDDIEAAYQSADFEETVALCRYAIRREWGSPRVYFYYGASLVALNRDYEGFGELEQAVGQDLSMAREAAALVYDRALADARSGERTRAARRLQKAVEFDPSLDIGPYAFLVADAYFEQKVHGRAAPLYKAAIEAFPDTSILEEAYFRMASSYDEMGWNEHAREAYDSVLTLYPRGEHKSESAWRLANLMYEQAEKEQVLGNYEEAVEMLSNLAKRTDNRGLLQKTHFLLGETHEAMGEYGAAYREYREVIRVDRGASGRIVERAREKIAALQEAGLK